MSHFVTHQFIYCYLYQFFNNKQHLWMKIQLFWRLALNGSRVKTKLDKTEQNETLCEGEQVKTGLVTYIV